jgi:uncharacterized membrane protein (DUF4010 family)
MAGRGIGKSLKIPAFAGRLMGVKQRDPRAPRMVSIPVRTEVAVPDNYATSLAYLTSLAVGFLIGLERERHKEAKAGVRTFALISLVGTLSAMLAEQADSPWILVSALVMAVGGVMNAYRVDSKSTPDAGTTTVVAAAVTFCLGAALWHGNREIVIAVAIVSAMLLHYKTQLETFSVELTAKDVESVLLFAVLSLVILPVVPNQGYGPYGALNPYHLWLMVVLISAVSLAGYVAWRLLGGRGPVLLLGALGGLVSSTATTLVYSRGARGKAELEGTAATVILLANLVVLLRLTVLAVAVEPRILPTMLPVVAAGLAVALPVVWMTWRRRSKGEAMENPELTNPTDLPVAIGFGVAYAVILMAAAWLNDLQGVRGVYAVAMVSGLTDVDAISLSSFRLLGEGSVTARGAVMTIVVALCSNIAVKASIVFVVGGASLGRRCIVGFGAVAAALLTAAALIPG